MIRDDEIDALQALAEAATQGPWKTDDPYIVYAEINDAIIYLANTSNLDTEYEQCEKDAAFVAAANPQTILALIDRLRRAEEESSRLNTLINTPELQDFAKGVVLESVHQRERWGTEHDDGKTAADWFWLIGYLAQKAMMHQLAGETDKAMHHTITTAAALANWHAAISGACNRMRPGISTPDSAESEGEKG